MALKAKYYKHTLNFRFDAGTSRGVLKNKDSYFIKIFEDEQPEIFGIGEAGPLKGLSVDFGNLAETKLIEIVKSINQGDLDLETLSEMHLDNFSSVKFSIENCINDFKNGGKKLIFDSDFFQNESRIKINGLVWMGDKAFMKSQIVDKIEAGFNTIKLKIGAIDFEEELEILKWIRKEFKNNELNLRVDANGAFEPEEALEMLKRLSMFNIHSIEQPIAINQWSQLAYLCENSPIDIALDEELIPNYYQKEKLLIDIKPQYLILKPSLMGGFEGSAAWIAAAEKQNVKWWITSALESNIGLNAICQFASLYKNELPQGLGTGKLYHNNIDSPLEIQSGNVFYKKAIDWNNELFLE